MLIQLFDIEIARLHHVNSTCNVVFTRCPLVIKTCHHVLRVIVLFSS